MASDCCVYLDYNATNPLEPKVLEAITTALKDAWGNPSWAEPNPREKRRVGQWASSVYQNLFHCHLT